MSLGKSIVQRVRAQSSEQMGAGNQKGGYFVEAAEGSIRARVELADAGRLGCLAMSLQVERTAGPEAADVPPAALNVRAEQLTKRLGYLMEDLGLVEIDCREGVCQIRSTPPASEEKGVSYYELILEEKGRATLTRYEKSAGETRRTPRSMNFSLEVLQRLVDDLAGVV
ncbi:MAG: hypothetical protein JRG73_04810 [Deltaproteobacteria bacterium]|nr:hypothetical protein [Deltaproteobacteria bacterium]